jgi:hypothetical protein
LNYVRKLGFEETPDYDFLRELFTKVIKNNGDVEDDIFDWNLLNGGYSLLLQQEKLKKIILSRWERVGSISGMFFPSKNGYLPILIYIYRVSTNHRCLQRECPRMQGTETDAEIGMIGDGLKHRVATWYLLLLLLLDMVLSNARYPLCLHRASSTTLNKLTFP